MSNSNLLSQFSTALNNAKTIFIVIPSNPKFDEVAASLGFYLSLKRQGKLVGVACDSEMTVKYASLVGLDRIEKIFSGGKESLVVSFDYKEEKVDKVSYNIEDDKFNLIIKPKEGQLPFDPQDVVFSYSGGKPDLVIAVNIPSLEEIKKLMPDGRDVIPEVVANIGYVSSDQETNLSLVDKNIASVSELVVGLISRLNLAFDSDIASNLLSGIEEATKMFSSNRTNSNTFEMAALCLRSKARRRVFSIGKTDERRQKQERQEEEKKEFLEERREFKYPQKEKSELQVVEPEPKPQKAKPELKSEPQEPQEESPSPDWLEPKIYKGNTRV